MSVPHTSYRHDIDGLRAIAVLSVVIAHINSRWLPGGFLGVDIFFVISGFLITSIVYREVKDGSFSFANFYTRRIKRILPVFFVVLFSVVPFMYGTWEFIEAHTVIRSGAAAVYFVANFLFGQTGDYFDPSMEESVFLHLWSLSVEEQFYFVFPLALIGLLYFKKTRQYLLPILIALAVVSLGLSFFNKELDITNFAAYYYPHLRFGEMLVGSILAISVIEHKTSVLDKYIHIIMPIALVLLVASFAFGSLFVVPFFPGPLALVPCLSVAALLYPQARVRYVARVLSWSPLVWVGKISYSLYLWHWVVLAYMRYFLDSFDPLSSQAIIVVVVLMFALSAITYYLVEQPVRKMNLSFKWSLICIYIVPASIYTGIFLYSYSLVGSYHYWDKELIERTMTKDLNTAMVTGELLGDSLQAKPTVLVAGDSHALHLTGFVDYLGKHEGWKALVSYRPGTPFFTTGIGRENKGGVRAQGDMERYHFLMQQLVQYDKIVLAAYWNKLQDQEFEELDKTLTELNAEDKEIVVINTMYSIGRLIRRDVHSPRASKLVHILGGYDYPIQKIKDERRPRIAQIKQLLAEKHPYVRWIDLSEMLPPSGLVEGKFIYPDKDHINYFAARWLAQEFLRRGQTLFPHQDEETITTDVSKSIDR